MEEGWKKRSIIVKPTGQQSNRKFITKYFGALAQLVARNTGSVEVRGSNPLRSTSFLTFLFYICGISNPICFSCWSKDTGLAALRSRILSRTARVARLRFKRIPYAPVFSVNIFEIISLYLSKILFLFVLPVWLKSPFS